MRQVKFTTFGANSAFGGFAPGDTLRCSPELARHLVEEIGCAQYMDAPTKAEDVPQPQASPRKRKTKE